MMVLSEISSDSFKSTIAGTFMGDFTYEGSVDTAGSSYFFISRSIFESYSRFYYCSKSLSFCL